MISIEEMEAMLDEIAEELPSGLYKDLNGGIVLLPDIKLHPKSKGTDLYILGEYHFNMNMGRYIVIYYGSFSRVYGYHSRDQIKEQLKSTLKHEFVHHVESLAGDRSLEKEDEKNITNYLRNNQTNTSDR